MEIKKVSNSLKVWYKNVNHIDCLKKGDMVVFPFLKGSYVPTTPYPQKFIVSKEFVDTDLIEIIPLTLTSFVKNVVQNFITMNLHRLFNVFIKLKIIKVRSIRNDIVKESVVTFRSNKSKLLKNEGLNSLIKEGIYMSDVDLISEMISEIENHSEILKNDERKFINGICEKYDDFNKLSINQVNWIKDIYYSLP